MEFAGDLEGYAFDASDEYPVLPDQDVGGWVYERAYFMFRFTPPTGLSGDGLDDYYDKTLGPLEEALDEILVPTLAEKRCFVYAMDRYVAYKRHGLPKGAGWEAEDSLEMHILECVISAHDRAERESRAAEEQMRPPPPDDSMSADTYG